MAWYSVVLKTAFKTRKLTFKLFSLVLFALAVCDQTRSTPFEIQYLVSFCGLRWKKSDAWKDAEQGSAMSSSDCFLLSGSITLWRISTFNWWANLFIAVCVTFRGHFLWFLFLSGIDLYWFPAMLCRAFILGCWIFTDIDFLTRINTIKNGGVCRTEWLLPHNVKCHLFWFFSL